VGAPTPSAAGQALPSQVLPHRVAAAKDPWPAHAVAGTAQRPGQSVAADVATAPVSTAEETPPVLGGGYAVQVTSERSESGAQAAFRLLQAKYPNQLGGRQAIIRRADLGAAGTYYRAIVGPFTSAEEAKRLCSGLKAAGADCIIQKN
jgi:hypothetical protein